MSQDMSQDWFDIAQSHSLSGGIVDEILCRCMIFEESGKTVCQIDPSYRAMLTPYIEKELLRWIVQNYQQQRQNQEITLVFSPVSYSPYDKRQQEIEAYIQKSKTQILQSELSEFLLSLGYKADVKESQLSEKLIAQKQLHH